MEDAAGDTALTLYGDVPRAFGLAVSFWEGLVCPRSASGLKAFGPAEKLKVATGASFEGECLGFY